MRDIASLNIGRKPAPDDLIFVQGFLNTLDVESGVDELATPAGVAQWFARHGRMPPGAQVSEDDRQRVVAVREALRAVLRSHHGEALDPRAAQALDSIAAGSPLRLSFAGSGRASLVPRGTDTGSHLVELLAIVHRAQLLGTWERLKVCAADTCQWAFFDSSRNRSGTWCSMEVCGNREKVREHRARQDH